MTVSPRHIKKSALAAALGLISVGASQTYATELEVTHWWTSGGEAAAVKVFALSLIHI